jgi:ATP-dependent Lon protease
MFTWKPKQCNKKDLSDIPNSILKQMEIVVVEHMDEVLSHALVLGDDDALFIKNDFSFELTSGEVEHRTPLINRSAMKNSN